MLKFRTINGITIAALISLLGVSMVTQIAPIYFIFILVGWLIFTFLGSYHIHWNYHLRSYISNKNISDNFVSITFDDGPNPKFTPEVLLLLRKFDAKATFFCVGKNIEAYPEIIQRIIAEGHTIGNHTYTHKNMFGFLSSEEVVKELEHTNSLVTEITGLTMRLFRPAFGITNPRIKKALKISGHLSIGWNKRSYDTTRLSEEIIVKRITNRLKKGDIILLHDSSYKTMRVLERLLLFLQTKKLQSVAVDQLLAVKPYA